MEREVGGGIGMGNTCKPVAVSFQCMTKSTTKKKKKKVSLSLEALKSGTDFSALAIKVLDGIFFHSKAVCLH